VLDLEILPRREVADVVAFRRGFPSLPILALADDKDPMFLFELGQARPDDVVILEAEGTMLEIRRAQVRALERSAASIVARRLGPLAGPGLVRVVRGALELTHRCWDTERFARSFGYSRPVLSERLREMGLPSPGQLLLWARLFHTGYWLPDPARSGESVSRQLEYANGAVFRRALRRATGMTPTEVIERGGLDAVYASFAEAHALPSAARRSSAA
jgi:AraC-like DNA-binding protein